MCKDGGAEGVAETDGAGPGDGGVGYEAEWAAVEDERAAAEHECPEICEDA